MKYFDNGAMVDGRFCDVSESAVEITDEEFEALCAALEQGKKIVLVEGRPAAVDPAPSLEDYDAAVEAHLKAERVARGYTTREPDVYAASSVERWRQDAADWIAHRDEVMVYALEVLNAVKAGGDAPPLDDFKAALPAISWTIE